MSRPSWLVRLMLFAISLLALMDRLPFSRAHYTLLVIGGLGYTFDGADNALVTHERAPGRHDDRSSRLAT